MADSFFQATNNTIMVVDDDPDLVTLIRAILEQKGFNVLCAYDGPQALDGLKKQKPDLILLDIMIPEMDGLEVLRRLKATTETSSIPVIILSALDQLKDISTGYRMGADYYIAKPFNSTQLMAVINHLLNEGRWPYVECLNKGQYSNVQEKVAIHQKIVLGSTMNCQRCQAHEAEYLVYSDKINLKVCIFCAITANEIGITPEVLHGLRTDHQPGDTQESLDFFYSAP